MNRKSRFRFRMANRVFGFAVLPAILVINSYPIIVFADKLVLISPHWEGIRYEFERSFRASYQRETGRRVDLEWLDVGGSSETLRFINSEFKNKPNGIGIDILFGGGYEPYLELKKTAILSPTFYPSRFLTRSPNSWPVSRYTIRTTPGTALP